MKIVTYYTINHVFYILSSTKKNNSNFKLYINRLEKSMKKNVEN